jgi:SAM-dependent methyltransferase
MILDNSLFKKITNIPFIWSIAQNFVGANQWKAALYPSVFENKGTLMDFGCSIGNETEVFLDFDYYGIDIDPHAIAAAKDRFNGYPHVRFFCTDIIKDGFKEDFFDHILFATAGHHLTDEQLAKIIEILLINLKPGGRLHFFDIIRQRKDKWSTQLLSLVDQGKYIRTQEKYEEIFAPYTDKIVRIELFPSPDRFIKLQDILYYQIRK